MTVRDDAARAVALKNLEFALSRVPGPLAPTAHTISDILDRVSSVDDVATGKEVLSVGFNLFCALLARRFQYRLTSDQLDVVILQSAEDARLSAMMEPLVRALCIRGYHALRLTAGSEVSAERFPGLGPADLAWRNTKVWWKAVFPTIKNWSRILLRFRRDGVLRTRDVVLILRWLIVQSRRLDHARQGLKGFDSRAVIVTDFDRGMKIAPWIIAAKSSPGLKSATLLHGQLRDLTYLPVLANTILVWDEIQAQFIAESGMEGSTEVRVAGAHWWPEVDVAMERGSRSAEGPRVVYAASGPGAPAIRKKQAMTVVEAIRSAGGHAVVRPHPLEDPAVYKGLDCEFEVSSEVSLGDSLSALDILITRRSTMADQAAAAGRTVLVMEEPSVGRTARLPGQVLVGDESLLLQNLCEAIDLHEKAPRSNVSQIMKGPAALDQAVDILTKHLDSRSFRAGRGERL